MTLAGSLSFKLERGRILSAAICFNVDLNRSCDTLKKKKDFPRGEIMPASFGYRCYICQAFCCRTAHMEFVMITVTDLLGSDSSKHKQASHF